MVQLWLCLVLSVFTLVEGQTNLQQGPCYTRKEYRDTTDEEWNLFREALLRLQATPSSVTGKSEWDLFTNTHLNNNKQTHGNVAFLPWHRMFLLTFERKLRSLDKKFATVSIPYWSFTYDWLEALSSPIFDPTSRYKLSVAADTGDEDVQYIGDCNYNRTIPRPHCLARFYREDLFSLFPSSEVTAMMLIQEDNFTKFSSKIEALWHGLIHVSIGGDLATMSSCNDPIFWMLHSSLDRLWSLWQKLHPISEQFPPSRMGQRMPGLSWVYRTMFDTSALCYDYLSFSLDVELSYPALLARQSSGAEDPVVVTGAGAINCLPTPLPKKWIEDNGMSITEVRQSEHALLNLIMRSRSARKCQSGNAIAQTGATPETADSPTGSSSRVSVTTMSGESVPGWAVGLLVLGAVVLAVLLGILVVVMRR